MATKAVGVVTDMIYGANDPTKVDVSMYIIGLESPPTKTGVTLYDLDPQSTTETWESQLANAVKSHAINGFGYSFGANDDAKCIGSRMPIAQSAQTRTLNTAFQISTMRSAWVSYSVQTTVTASISGGQNGDVILEIASNSGMSTNLQTIAIAGCGQSYTLAIALQGVQPQTCVLAGLVPAGYYARLRTANNTGTPSYSYRAGQETLL